jgi:hypothetical protein
VIVDANSVDSTRQGLAVDAAGKRRGHSSKVTMTASRR